MSNITYIQPDGSRKTIEIPAGRTVRDGAISNMIPGIISECGGACSCATCHVYVDENWIASTGGPGSEDEAEMLEFTAMEATENSRLSCQITVTDELDGLVVYVPAEQ
jgi:2Fe-2S ferredoxin